MIHLNTNIKVIIENLWDKFWSGGIANPLTAIEQITYLLFMKRLDELDSKMKLDNNLSYNSKFSGTFKLSDDESIDKEKLKWSYFKNLDPDLMLMHVQKWVFPFLKELNGETSPFTKHMKNAVFIIPKASLLAEAINEIEEIYKEIGRDANENGHTFQDILGDVYEFLLSEIATSGKNGQFRTPRHIINMIVELVEPKYGQKIADPACGTAGFLLGVYQYLITQTSSEDEKRKLVRDEDGFIRTTSTSSLNNNMKNIMSNNLCGYDFDVTMVRLGLMNLIMHGIENPNIDYKDTLSRSYNQDNEFDIVLANPPFTGSIDKSDINEKLILPTTKTELLFIQRIYNMLKEGGTAGIIVPQGVLFNENKAFMDTRKMLVESCELIAVITMPSGVFKPYAGVSTAVLLFTKGRTTSKVWFYDMQSDGYTLDDKREKRDLGYGDLQDIIKKYKTRTLDKNNDRRKKQFWVDKKEITNEFNNYNLMFNNYREDVYTDIELDEPEKILERIINIEVDIQNNINEIVEMLNAE